MAYKLVKFEDGSFGARKGILWYSYYDFQTAGFSWGRGSDFFPHCKTTEAKARSFIENTKKKKPLIFSSDAGTVVEDAIHIYKGSDIE